MKGTCLYIVVDSSPAIANENNVLDMLGVGSFLLHDCNGFLRTLIVYDIDNKTFIKTLKIALITTLTKEELECIRKKKEPLCECIKNIGELVIDAIEKLRELDIDTELIARKQEIIDALSRQCNKK